MTPSCKKHVQFNYEIIVLLKWLLVIVYMHQTSLRYYEFKLYCQRCALFFLGINPFNYSIYKFTSIVLSYSSLPIFLLYSTTFINPIRVNHHPVQNDLAPLSMRQLPCLPSWMLTNFYNTDS